MLFHAHKRPLSFELGKRRYNVPLGTTVDIPDHLAYCVEARGIHLAKGPSPSGERVAGEEIRRSRPAVEPEAIVDAKTAAEELADVTGEDPPAEDDERGAAASEADDEESDSDIAERTAAQLEAQGIRLPGSLPGKRSKRGA
jgi:hypothetical protein